VNIQNHTATVSLFCANAIMTQSNDFADLFEQGRFRHEDFPSLEVMRMEGRGYLTQDGLKRTQSARPLLGVKVDHRRQGPAIAT
jgi:hypothetical protein